MQPPTDRHAFVTGANGFVGKRLVQTLVARGWKTTGFVRSGTRPIPDWMRDVDVAVGDLRDRDCLGAAMKGAQVVFHCGAVLPRRADENILRDVNVQGTQNVIDSCIRNEVERLVHVSSDAIYGDTSNVAATEETPADPDFPTYVREGIYPQTKLEAERLVLAAGKDHGLSVVVIRSCRVYGPGISPGTEILQHWGRRPVKLLLGGGRSRLNFVFVDDLVEALILAASTPSAGGQIFNINDGHAYTKREVIELVARITGKPRFVIPIPARLPYLFISCCDRFARRLSPRLANRFDVRRVLFAVSDHVSNGEKARRMLGYTASVTLEEGVERALLPAGTGRAFRDEQ